MATKFEKEKNEEVAAGAAQAKFITDWFDRLTQEKQIQKEQNHDRDWASQSQMSYATWVIGIWVSGTK